MSSADKVREIEQEIARLKKEKADYSSLRQRYYKSGIADAITVTIIAVAAICIIVSKF